MVKQSFNNSANVFESENSRLFEIHSYHLGYDTTLRDWPRIKEGLEYHLKMLEHSGDGSRFLDDEAIRSVKYSILEYALHMKTEVELSEFIIVWMHAYHSGDYSRLVEYLNVQNELLKLTTPAIDLVNAGRWLFKRGTE